jgi:hypothetical protein
MKAYGEVRAVAPLVLNFGTGWMWDVISTLLLLCLRRENFRYPLVTRVGGPQVWSERYGESNRHFWVVQLVAQSLCRLHYPFSRENEGNHEMLDQNFTLIPVSPLCGRANTSGVWQTNEKRLASLSAR